MTEEEAKTKWCPQSRLSAKPTTWGNLVEEVNNGRCIGSACMAWRLATRSVLFNPETRETKPSVWGQSYDGSKFILLEKEDPQNGFCGLAGKP